MPKRFPKPIIYTLAVILLLLLSTQTVLGKRILLDNTLIKAIKNFLSSPETIISACDYKDGYIILVKPIATGVGEGRYEAGDIVEIRNGQELCARFGNSNFLGNEERTTLLPLYYPKKLTEEEKKELLAPEYSISNDKFPMTNQIQNPNDQTTHPNPSAGGDKPAKLLRRRSTGIDYAQILSDREIIKARSQEQIDRIPEVDLSNIIDKNPTLSGPTALGETASQKNKLTDLKSVLNNTQAVGPLNTKTVLQNLKISKLFENLKFKIENYGHDSVVHLPPIVAIYEKTKNTLTSIARLVVSPVIAQSSPTEVTKTVDTGGYADYLSLNAWEAGQQADLTSTNEIRIAKCQHKTATSTADAIAVVIDGWTTDSTRYIKIWTDPAESYRHAGVWNAAKYNLTNSGPIALSINESEVYIDGLQFSSAPTSGQDGTIDLGASSGNIWISNSIIKQYGSPTAGYQAGIKVYVSGSGTLYVWNTIIYNYSASNNEGIEVDDSDYTCYFYNLTIHNCFQGIAQWNGTVYALNCLTQSCGDGFYGSFTSSNYNLSDIAGDAPGANSRNGPVDGAVIFADEEADDFHLASNDAGALAYAISSVNSLFTDDIDGQARPYGLGASSTKWDIGADEFRPTEIYRSVGPGNTSALSAGYTAGATLAISGSSATFSTPLADNIGVGDVIIYTSTQGTSNTATNSVAFIHGRTDSTHYTVKDVAGKMASSTYQATSKWAIYRAYTSLANAESGDENDGLPDSLETFESWTDGKNLASSTEQWNIACYGDAVDTVTFYINGWTTTADNYIKIYTPYLPTEVGISQRHQGKYSTTAYRREVFLADTNDLAINTGFVRIDGLQFQLTSTSGSNTTINTSATLSSGAEIQISNCIGQAVLSGTAAGVFINLSPPISGTMLYKVWNNIAYDYTNGTTTCRGIWLDSGTGHTLYAHNNTIYNSYIAYRATGGTYISKNNIAQGSNDDGFSGTFDNTSDYNLSDIAGDTTGGTHDKSGVIVKYVDVTNDNFHLSPSDTSARDQGANLTNDAYLSFSTDIDGETRCAQCATGGWDIGADEVKSYTEINSTRGLPASLTSGLVGYWSFNGQDMDWGSTTAEALDRSSYSNNGDAINMSPSSAASGILGQGLKFDGVDDNVKLADNSTLDPLNDMTWSAWVKLRTLPSVRVGTENALIIQKNYSGGIDYSYKMYITNANKVSIDWVNSAPTQFSAFSISTLSANTWYFLTGVRNGSSLKVYINSVDDTNAGAGTPTGILGNSNNPLFIGSDNGTQLRTDGLIDEVRIYNRALSESEIQSLYKAGASAMQVNAPPPASAGLSSGLVGNWTFNGQDMDWASTTAEAQDMSSYNNHGNIINFSQSSAVSGISGQALKFDGVDDWVRIPNSSSLNTLTTNFSAIAWVKAAVAGTGVDSDYRMVYTSGTQTNFWSMGFENTRVFRFGGTTNAWGNHSLIDTNWHQIAIVKNGDSGTNLTFYWDGNFDGDAAVGSVTAPTGDKYIGVWADQGWGLFNGLIDEVRVYNRALSPAEIQQLYKLGSRSLEIRQ